MKIVEVDIDKVIPYANNPRQNEEAVEPVAKSIKQFGFQQPIVVDKDMVVIVGHTRLKAAKKLKLKKVPVIIASELSEEKANAYRLADNKVGEKAEWDMERLGEELDKILEIDMAEFGFDLEEEEPEELPDVNENQPSMQHDALENQEIMMFPQTNYYGIPEMEPTDTVGDKFLRFCDWKDVDNPGDYIAHFYYDDYKFIQAWREPDKYIGRLKEFKAVVSPDFSLYTDFPRTLQIW